MGRNTVLQKTSTPTGRVNSDVSYDTISAIDDTTSRQYIALENARNYFNKHLFIKVFGVSLGPTMLRPAEHRKALGYYRETSWKENAHAPVPEISLCPYGLHRSPEKIFSNVVHELSHQYQKEYGKPGRGRYHNQEFAEIMRKVGLICPETGEPRGKQTGDRMTHYVDPEGMYAAAFFEIPKEYLLPFKPLFEDEYYTRGYHSVLCQRQKLQASIAKQK